MLGEMAMSDEVMKLIKDKEVQYVDLRFTDLRGKMQHVTFDVGMIDKDTFEEGLMFDGSSIAGWKAINESDMILRPDLDAVYADPFSATPMLVICCDIVDPGTGELYARDPRSTAKRAESYLQATGVGDTVYVGPEAEFFMFDDVRFEDSYNASTFVIDDVEFPTNTAELLTPTSNLLGDVDNNGVVNALDIPPYVSVLTNPAAATLQQFYAADINNDARATGVDTQPFLSLLAP